MSSRVASLLALNSRRTIQQHREREREREISPFECTEPAIVYVTLFCIAGCWSCLTTQAHCTFALSIGLLFPAFNIIKPRDESSESRRFRSRWIINPNYQKSQAVKCVSTDLLFLPSEISRRWTVLKMFTLSPKKTTAKTPLNLSFCKKRKKNVQERSRKIRCPYRADQSVGYFGKAVVGTPWRQAEL